jgi:hypothetical protein
MSKKRRERQRTRKAMLTREANARGVGQVVKYLKKHEKSFLRDLESILDASWSSLAKRAAGTDMSPDPARLKAILEALREPGRTMPTDAQPREVVPAPVKTSPPEAPQTEKKGRRKARRASSDCDSGSDPQSLLKLEPLEPGNTGAAEPSGNGQ